MTARRIAVCAALGPLVLALLGLAAWATGLVRLASFGATYIPMAPITAIAFLLMSAALIALSLRPDRGTRAAARMAATLVMLLAAAKLIEFFTGAALLNIEAALVPRPGEFGSVPLARMSPLTAAGFLVAGLALVCLAAAPRKTALDGGAALGALAAAGGAIVVLGYVYDAPLLYGGRIIPMALTTALAFIGTGIALVAAAGPRCAVLAPFCEESTRGRMLRVFLPLTVLAVLLNSILTSVILARVQAHPALLAAVFALVSAVVVGIAVSGVSRALGGTIDRAQMELEHAREELERRVTARTAELSALNQELESFSYSVSHDLRAPLRHVAGFAALLEKDAGPQLDARQRQHLTKVTDAARRMGTLIDDLLALSRNSRAVLRKRPVSLDAMVRTAQAEVAPQGAGRQITWRVQENMPEVLVDPELFHLVLVNLLSNAVKYTAPQPDARIEIGASTESPDETVLFVADNGAGFDMNYVHKLFGVFQRLHSSSEFEGTGVGLANVSRLVRRHGGRVWAESEVGRGATFYVGLPAHPHEAAQPS